MAKERELEALQQRLSRLSLQLAVSEEEQRRRIASDLHDGLGQTLQALKMTLAELSIASDDRARAAVLARAESLWQESISQVRGMIAELSPPVLYDLGFVPGLRWLVGHLHHQLGLEVEMSVEKGAQTVLSPGDPSATLLFRCIRELLFNVARHAGVSKASLEVGLHEGEVWIEVRDEGAGFDPKFKIHEQAFGLFSVKERVEAMGGQVDLVSAPGSGTRVLVKVPLSRERLAGARSGEDSD